MLIRSSSGSLSCQRGAKLIGIFKLSSPDGSLLLPRVCGSRDQGTALRHSFKNQEEKKKKIPFRQFSLPLAIIHFLGLCREHPACPGLGAEGCDGPKSAKIWLQPPPPAAEPAGAISSLFIEDPGGCSPRPQPGELRQLGGNDFIPELEEKSSRGRSEELQGEQRGSQSGARSGFGLE